MAARRRQHRRAVPQGRGCAGLYYTWSKEFMEAGNRRLACDTSRAATIGEVQDLRREARALKECVADLTLENRLLKKSMIADDEATQVMRGITENRMTKNEVSRIRKARDHQNRRAVAPACKADARQAGRRPSTMQLRSQNAPKFERDSSSHSGEPFSVPLNVRQLSTIALSLPNSGKVSAGRRQRWLELP
jgi:hypothetical protein